MFLPFTITLVIAQAIILLFPLLFKFPPRLDLTPLFALAILWMNRFIFSKKSGTSANGAPVFRVILWILFAFIGLIGVVSAIFMVFSAGDREQREAPVVFGKTESLKTIAIVYHPGGSELPRKITTRIAEKIAQHGVRVTIFTANTGLRIKPQDFAAVGFASPVYGGNIRPPLVSYLHRTDLSGVKCFGIVTGWAQAAEAQDLEKVQNLIATRGGIFIAGKKFTAASIRHPGEMDILVARIMERL